MRLHLFSFLLLLLLPFSSLALESSSAAGGGEAAKKLFYFPLRIGSQVECEEAARQDLGNNCYESLLFHLLFFCRDPYTHGVRIRAGFGKMMREDYELIKVRNLFKKGVFVVA